jgi:hypothetical protein
VDARRAAHHRPAQAPPISLNGRDISGDESEIYHGDVIRFGDTPRHEARYINPKIRGVHFLE